MQILFLTSQRLITEHWPAVRGLLEPALRAEHGEFTVDDLEEMCREGRAVSGLVLRDNAPLIAFAFEFRHFPRKVVLNVMALAGRDLDAALSTFWSSFREWAEESGASDIQACARPAMTRKLRKLGFSHTYNVVRTPTGVAS